MATEDKIYEGSRVPIVLNLGVDLSGAAAATLEIVGPVGEESWPAVVYQETKLKAIPPAGLTLGWYRAQGKPNIPGVENGLSATKTFKVFAKGK